MEDLLRAGVGAALLYATQWWYPYGIDYPETVKSVSMFNEGINALKMLLDDNKTAANVSPSVYFAGKYFKLNGCSFTKSIKKIPITLSANKNKMMKIGAQYSDVWESSCLSPMQFCSLRSRLRGIYPKLKMLI